MLCVHFRLVTWSFVHGQRGRSSAWKARVGKHYPKKSNVKWNITINNWNSSLDETRINRSLSQRIVIKTMKTIGIPGDDAPTTVHALHSVVCYACTVCFTFCHLHANPFFITSNLNHSLAWGCSYLQQCNTYVTQTSQYCIEAVPTYSSAMRALQQQGNIALQLYQPTEMQFLTY